MKKTTFFIILTVITILLSGQILIAKDKSDFSQEDYDRAIRGDKDLIGVQLEKADLKGINLSGADLRGAELEEANLENADLTNANLQNADLEEANLKGAKINGANFKGAEMEFTVWIDGRVCSEDSVGSCH